MNNIKYKSEVILVLHLALGFAISIVPQLAIIYSMLIFVYGLYRIFLHRNRDGVAPLIAAYFVGSEVLLRMFGSNLSYEFAKLATIFFLVLGILMVNEKREKPRVFMVFILILLPSLLVIDYPTFDAARQLVSFNLTGPISLGVSVIYLYKRKFSVIQLRKLFLCLLYPISTMLIVIYFRTGSLDDIVFTTESNFRTSGGFGPNQVSTTFGLGVTIIALAYFMNIRLFRLKYLDLVLMFAFFVRGLATFSRGGVLAPIIAVVLCVIIMSFSDRGFRYRINKMAYVFIVLVVVGFLGFNYVNDVSGGLLEMRFKGESMYDKTADNMYSGREDIFKEDLEIFQDNVFLGIGPGMGSYVRPSGISAHIEYSRLLAEHGIFGVTAILIILLAPVAYFFKLKSTDNKMLLIICVVFTCVSLGHSAMRIAAPGFIYGVAFINLVRKPRV